MSSVNENYLIHIFILCCFFLSFFSLLDAAIYDAMWQRVTESFELYEYFANGMQ